MVDIAPTVLDLLGLELGSAVDGQSLSSLLRGQREPVRDRNVFLQRRPYPKAFVSRLYVHGPEYAVRSGRWKLIHEVESGSHELYDLESDPTEQENEIYRKPAVAKRLGEVLAKWRARYSTPEAPTAVGAKERRALESLGYVE